LKIIIGVFYCLFDKPDIYYILAAFLQRFYIIPQLINHFIFHS